MNVASLELCRDLYRVSGWNDVENGWYLKAESGPFAVRHLEPDHHKDWTYSTPAYDLSYLLLKLPEEYFLYKRDGQWVIGDYVANNWTKSDTPEDAACLLVIDLVKQGILEKGGK